MHQEVDDFTPNGAKGPVPHRVTGRSKGNAEDDEEEVCHSKTDNKDVGGILHLFVRPYNKYY